MRTAAIASQPPLADSFATLTNLGQVAALSLDLAAKSVNVKVRGTVTYSDKERGALFIQEAGDAIAVRVAKGHDGADLDFQPGQVLELEGSTASGRAQPVIRSRSVRIVDQGQMPSALSLDSDGLYIATAESRLVRVKGWIPAVTRFGGRLSLELIVRPGQSLEVVLNGGDVPESKELPGSLVELSGVFTLKFDAAGQISGGRLYVSDLTGIRKLRSIPISSISDIGNASGQTPNEPFRIRGTVVNHSLGKFLVVRDNSGSLRIPYRGLNYFNSGSPIEVFACPVRLKPELVLTNVTAKVILSDSPNEEPAAAIITPAAPSTNLNCLTQVMDVRKLSPQQASRGYPVNITGVVTFSDLPSYLHFVQDGTAGIYFDATKIDKAPVLRAGVKVQIKGFSAPGDYAPIIVVQSIRVVGDDVLPTPESVTFRKLMTGNFDSQWVELKGVVRNEWVETNVTRLALFSGDGIIKATLRVGSKEMETPSIIDAAVAIRGVCTTVFDDHRRLQGVELQVPGWQQVEIKERPSETPFRLPVRAVGDLFQFHAGGTEMHRAHLMGVVTLPTPDGSFYLQDGSGGILIQPKQSSPAAQVGTTMDVVGFPAIVDKLAMLQDAVVNPLKDRTFVEPVELKPEATLDDSLQAELIRLQGEIVGHFSHASEELLTLRFGQRIIDVVLEKGFRQDQLAEFPPGTVVRLTGVFLGQCDSTGKVQSFRLMLRSAADTIVISRPGWWTVQRTLWALAGLVAILLLALGWVRALRQQVQQRTQELHAEIEHHKCTEAKLEAEIAERKRMELEVERSHQELLIASRQAGMAEVATSVLHNVGNVLNSVNVSASLVADKIRKSKISNISRAAEMIQEHAHDLPEFLTQDPKGRQLPQYLGRLAKHLDEEQMGILAELDSLRKNVEHIKGIVGMQQNYAKVFGSAEAVKPTELVEDALRMNSGALVRHDVHVIREYEPNLPEVTVDKHKLLQILVNLICNAKKACDESIHPEKLLTVRVVKTEARLKISVIDNGVGIPPENLTKIFNHGFTTRKDGHGFGLHSGALAAKEMGGALVAQSEGHGKGASFTVELPV